MSVKIDRIMLSIFIITFVIGCLFLGSVYNDQQEGIKNWEGNWFETELLHDLVHTNIFSFIIFIIFSSLLMVSVIYVGFRNEGGE